MALHWDECDWRRLTARFMEGYALLISCDGERAQHKREHREPPELGWRRPEAVRNPPERGEERPKHPGARGPVSLDDSPPLEGLQGFPRVCRTQWKRNAVAPRAPPRPHGGGALAFKEVLPWNVSGQPN